MMSQVVGRATVHVADGAHLCLLQARTRELCRSNGLSEADVFQAAIAASELAHRRFIAGERAGDIDLSVVRRKKGLGVEIRARENP